MNSKTRQDAIIEAAGLLAQCRTYFDLAMQTDNLWVCEILPEGGSFQNEITSEIREQAIPYLLKKWAEKMRQEIVEDAIEEAVQHIHNECKKRGVSPTMKNARAPVPC